MPLYLHIYIYISLETVVKHLSKSTNLKKAERQKSKQGSKMPKATSSGKTALGSTHLAGICFWQ